MKYFFELIQVAVGSRGRLSGIPSEKEWRFLFREAKRQALLGVLFGAIEQLPAEQRPQKMVLLPWYDVAEKIKTQNRRLNQEAVKVGKFLEEKGMTYTLLKGQGNAMYYPNPLLRTPGDLDVWVRQWVHPECALFEKRRELYSWVKRTYGPLDGVSYNHVHAPLSEVAEVELHVTPSFVSAMPLNALLQRYFRTMEKQLAEVRVDFPEGAGRICVPTVEFNRFYLLLHIYRHLFSEGIGLRQLMDYYYVLRQPATAESRARTVELLRQLKMLRFAGAAMYVLKQVFGLEKDYWLVEPDAKEGKFLLMEILQAGNFGQYDSRIDRVAYRNRWRKFFLSVKRNVRFVRRYPHEIWFDPFFRASFYIYRKLHGWG